MFGHSSLRHRSRGGALAHFYQNVVDWFTSLGYRSNKMGINGSRGGKLGSFEHANAKLLKTGFEGVFDFEVISAIPGGRRPNDYVLTAICSRDVRRSYVSVVARSSIASLSNASMLPFVRTIIQDLKPTYGIGYTRDHSLGPQFYAVGICYGGDDVPTGQAYEEQRNIGRWGDLGMDKQVYRDGLLRDVYPWNFLTKPQLTKLVDGITLEKWIRQDPRRGTLGELSGDVLLWELDSAELPWVRQALHQSEAIFNWRKYISTLT